MRESMKYPYRISVRDYHRARQTIKYVSIGHYFIFAEDQRALPDSLRVRGRNARLQLERPEKVFPLLSEPVELAGLTLAPHPKNIEPLACVVADRNVYRAETDNVHLFVAFPSSPDDLYLIIEHNGGPFDIREVKLAGGAGMEVLSMLQAGNYSASLSLNRRTIGVPVFFTVAEYALPPLSARLVDHSFSQDEEEFLFTLAVESYHMPFDEELLLILSNPGAELARGIIRPLSPGEYKGSLRVAGQGPFRLCLTGVDDPKQISEIFIPVRQSDQENFVVSELGREMLFSDLPAPDAMPILGGHLKEGNFLDTPLIVENIVSSERIIHVRRDVESLWLIIFDLLSGTCDLRKVGDMDAGKKIRVETEGPASLIFTGCLAKGRPFEAYTLFAEPNQVQLFADVPGEVRPGEDIRVLLRCEGTNRRTPVYLTVREESPDASDTPDAGLRTSLRRNITSATEGMAENAFSDINFPDEAFDLSDEEMLEISDEDENIDFDADMMGADYYSDDTDFPELELPLETDEEHFAESYDIRDMGDDLDSEKEDDLLKTMEFAALSIREEVSEIRKSDFPKVLFSGIIPVGTSDEVLIPAEEGPGRFVVEAFAPGDFGWIHTRTKFVVKSPVQIELNVPSIVNRGDRIIGDISVAGDIGKTEIHLKCDGIPVQLRKRDSSEAFDKEPAFKVTEPAESIAESPVELVFDVQPGIYTAEIRDTSDSKIWTMEKTVGEPGKFRSYAKELRLLQKGESFALNSENDLCLRVLPSLDKSFDMLLGGIADYPHLCCEQTAAKILASVFIYLTDERKGGKFRAEQMILSGIARERKMLRPGRGFAMYPNEDRISETYSKLAVRHLWHLDQMKDIPDLSVSLRSAIHKGLLLADQAAKAHQMERVPEHIRCVEDAHAAIIRGGDVASASRLIENLTDFSETEARLRKRQYGTAERASMAYAAACLMAMGDSGRGIKLANQVMRHFNEQGTLYSTRDSVAMIALMLQIEFSGLMKNTGRIRANGREMSVSEAANSDEPLKSVDVTEGIVAVEMTKILEEDWGDFAHAFPLKIGFRDPSGKKVRRFKIGNRVDLVVSLREGYQPGDILHIALPDCLLRTEGDVRLKRFTVDFEGGDDLRIPVLVTSKIEGKQHFALCVRNMFREERATSPGILTLKGKTLADKAKSLINRIIG